MIMRLTGILLCSHFRDGAASTVIIVYEKSSSPSLLLPCGLKEQRQIEALQRFSFPENIPLQLKVTFESLKIQIMY